MTGQVWAYARVSTRDQNPQLQLDALEASGYDTLVQEKESAKRGVLRPAWQDLLPVPQPGDTLKFWKSDRWGRSAADVLATVNELRDRGVTVVSLTENFDLATKEGRLMFGVLALAAEYELELRAERQADGIAAARRRQAEGRMLPGKKHIGRPPATGPPSSPPSGASSPAASPSPKPPASSRSDAPPPTPPSPPPRNKPPLITPSPSTATCKATHDLSVRLAGPYARGGCRGGSE